MEPKQEIIFRATVWRKSPEQEKRIPLTVTLYSNGLLTERWDGSIIHKIPNVIRLPFIETFVIGKFQNSLRTEIQNLRRTTK